MHSFSDAAERGGVKSVGEYMNPSFLHFPMHISVYTVKEKQRK